MKYRSSSGWARTCISSAFSVFAKDSAARGDSGRTGTAEVGEAPEEPLQAEVVAAVRAASAASACLRVAAGAADRMFNLVTPSRCAARCLRLLLRAKGRLVILEGCPSWAWCRSRIGQELVCGCPVRANDGPVYARLSEQGEGAEVTAAPSAPGRYASLIPLGGHEWWRGFWSGVTSGAVRRPRRYGRGVGGP